MDPNAKAEIPQILADLDQGKLMTRFFKKGRRPERRILCLRIESFEILQFPSTSGRQTIPEESSAQTRGAHIATRHARSS